MSELETFVQGIGHLLSDRLLAIPDFQRPYSWTADDQVPELFRDLAGAIAANADEYFLGSVVTSPPAKTGRVEVIDGQQRLATVSLLYAALRDIFYERADERAQDIERRLLGERDIVTRKLQQRLTLNAEDNEIFRQITLEKPDQRVLNPTLISHRRILEGYTFLRGELLALVDGLPAESWQDPLLRWYAFIFDRAAVIEVRVSGEQRAFVIFETLNTRGLDLSTTDLLRNHLLGTAGDRIEEAKTKWARGFAGFGATDARPDPDVFLRHYWASKKGVVRVKALFSQIKPTITTPDESIALLDEVVECAPIWTGLFDAGGELWSDFRMQDVAAVDTLSKLDVQQCRPLLLAAFRRLAQVELQRLVDLILGWSIRWFVVGGGSAGTVERLYAEAARRVTDGELTTAPQIAATFAGAVPGDLAFREAFAIMTVRRGWLARYYLHALEKAERGDPEPELIPNEDVEKVNLEHVLPRNPAASWQANFTAEEILGMRLLLGNQALLRKSHNNSLGNKSFAEKKLILSGSDLLLTNQVGAEADWTPARIRTRQAHMAGLAVAIWPGV